MSDIFVLPKGLLSEIDEKEAKIEKALFAEPLPKIFK